MSEDTTEIQTLDCVICYNEIDVNDRKGYMLAPCDHIFHRHCLEQWMDVKVSHYLLLQYMRLAYLIHVQNAHSFSSLDGMSNM